MSGHVSLSFEAAVPNRCGHVVQALLGSAELQIVGIGGASCSGRKGDKWDFFLAGWALERFASYWGRDTMPRPRSIEVAGSIAEEVRYLDDVASGMQKRRSFDRALSPRESLDEMGGVTRLDAPRLAASVIDAMELWNRRFVHAGFRIYVALPIAARGEAPLEGGGARAFQGLLDRPNDAIGVPLLLITVETPLRNPTRTEVGLMSSSPIWLREAAALNGRVEPADADANVALLARIGATLAEAVGTASKPPSLKLETRTFLRETDRIHAEFAAHIPNLSADTAW